MNRLLLIDDEPSIVRVLSISLRADGYEVLTASNGPEGLATFQREKPAIIITDIKMPGMDGIAVLEKIKVLEPDAEVIIITGHGDIDNAIEALKHGASDFISKPIRDEALTIALQRAKEKLDIKKKLKEYTNTLEREVGNATRALRRQSNFLSKLIKSSNDGIVATDKDFNIVIFNPGAERIFGLAAEEVMQQRTLMDLYPQELKDTFNNVHHPSKRKNEMSWEETTITAKNGTSIPVRFSGTHLYEGTRMMGSVAFFQDLREIKRLEMELVKSERLAAVGQTVAGLAHGIKNILHGLKGGSYLLDLGLKKNDTAKLRNGWDMIKRNIDRTSDLVLNLLSYSKERAPEYEPCSPNEIAADVCALLADKAEENKIEITKDFDPSIAEVLMDPRMIHEVLLNLMSNAIDACLFDEDTTKRWQVRLKTARENSDFIKFEVTDNGVGMNPEVQQKLFTSFFSTKGHRGTGLGLMVTRKILDEHRGSITVSSQLAKGTTFTVLIPHQAAGMDNKVDLID